MVTPFNDFASGDAKQLVLVAVGTANDPPPKTEERLMTLFSLSPTQAALAVAIYNGESLSDFAKTRRNKLTTIRSHLRNIFTKTGARNQVDLVRLISALPPI